MYQYFVFFGIKERAVSHPLPINQTKICFLLILLMEEFQNNHLGCKKLCKLSYQHWLAGFLNHQPYLTPQKKKLGWKLMKFHHFTKTFSRWSFLTTFSVPRDISTHRLSQKHGSPTKKTTQKSMLGPQEYAISSRYRWSLYINDKSRWYVYIYIYAHPPPPRAYQNDAKDAKSLFFQPSPMLIFHLILP